MVAAEAVVQAAVEEEVALATPVDKWDIDLMSALMVQVLGRRMLQDWDETLEESGRRVTIVVAEEGAEAVVVEEGAGVGEEIAMMILWDSCFEDEILFRKIFVNYVIFDFSYTM